MNQSKLKPKSKPAPSSREKRSAQDVPVRPLNYPPRVGVNFTEAVGKTIAFINYVDDAPDWQGLEVRFTDGTLLSFDLMPCVRVRADYMECRNGDLEMIRDYGIVASEETEDDDRG